MKKEDVKILSVLIAVVLIVAASVTYFQLTQLTQKQSTAQSNLSAEMYVYVNHKLVQHSPDPLTDNFYNWFLALLEGYLTCPVCSSTPSLASYFNNAPLITPDSDYGSIPSTICSGGGYKCGIQYFTFSQLATMGTGCPSGGCTSLMYVALGTGTGTPAVGDFHLFSQFTTVAATATFSPGTATIPPYVNYTASYTASTSVTITEAGLVLLTGAIAGSGCTNNCAITLLMSHDALSPSISLTSGSVIAVTFQIRTGATNQLVLASMLYQCSAHQLPPSSGIAIQVGSQSAGYHNYCIDSTLDWSTANGATCPIFYANSNTGGGSGYCTSVSVSYGAGTGKLTILGNVGTTITGVNTVQYIIYPYNAAQGYFIAIPLTLSTAVNLAQGQYAGFQITAT